jgi:3'(2'), 5'-bisphosphate nucleotidase
MDLFNQKSMESIITNLIGISILAGEKILESYESNEPSELKADGSPVTKADKESHQVITDGIKNIWPSLPILSEEDSIFSFSERSKWQLYWLIDPLDGTKEFLKKNGEFTTNIALISNNIPIIGVVHNPLSKETYVGSELLGSYLYKQNEYQRKLIIDSKKEYIVPRIIVSRSHKNQKTTEFLNLIGKHKIIESGSSIKFCLIADNQADIYPRLAPTSEWDTAAGQAVAMYAGASILTSTGPLEYNKKSSYINVSFFVTNEKYEKLFSIFKDLDSS